MVAARLLLYLSEAPVIVELLIPLPVDRNPTRCDAVVASNVA